MAQTPPKKYGDLWVLKPAVRPAVPAAPANSANPIDAFIAANYKIKKLRPAAPADKLTLLRRVYLDLIGLPPTPAEQDAFLNDQSPDAYEKVVDRLLASQQHGVRYARKWLDVLRYADVDERMTAAAGIHYWRDWVIYALNSDMPYDEFVRAQLTGYRTMDRTTMSATGYRSKAEPRPDDMFALGFLARGDVVRDGKNTQEMPIMAVETISTAFMGLTVGCAKCHDHMYDPISQRSFYSMKALFDPLVVRKVTLATPDQIMAQSRTLDEAQKKRAAAEAPLNALIEPYKNKLYDDRLAMLPADVQAIIRKAEDATNDISYMVLETIRETRLTQPNVSARIHTGTPDRFLLECARTIRLGTGMPAIKNDEIIVPALLDKGVRSKDAYDYAIVGCIEAAVPGKWGYRNTGMSFLNLLKVLELTLNNGTDLATGAQLLRGRGDLTAFDSMESLYAAYREQLRYYIRMSIQADTVADLCLEEMAPDAFCSSLVDDCIARGKTIKEGGATYDIVSGRQSGVANVADAFMALKTRVFDEKALTAAQVKEALAADFQNPGGELVRQRLLHAPKYGNDLAEVDGIAARVLNDYLDEANHYHNTRHGRGPIGGGYAGSTSNISANVPLGASVSATPDGRRAGEPIAEGVSPVHGCDTGGPTKVLRSLSRLPTIKSIAQLLNLRLSPESLESEEGLYRLVTLRGSAT